MSLFSIVILYFLFESGLIFLVYRIQDSIGPDAVFRIVHTTYALFDMATMVTDAIIRIIFNLIVIVIAIHIIRIHKT